MILFLTLLFVWIVFEKHSKLFFVFNISVYNQTVIYSKQYTISHTSSTSPCPFIQKCIPSPNTSASISIPSSSLLMIFAVGRRSRM